jgi:hypothetical protein
MNVPVFPGFWTIVCVLYDDRAYLRSASILTLSTGQSFDPADIMLKNVDLVLDMIRRGIFELPRSVETALEQPPNRSDPMLLLAVVGLLSLAEQVQSPLMRTCVERLHRLAGNCESLHRMVDAMAEVSSVEPGLFLNGAYHLIDVSIAKRFLHSTGDALIRIAPALHGDSHWCTWNPENALMEDESIVLLPQVYPHPPNLLPFELALIRLLEDAQGAEDMSAHLADTLGVPIGSIHMACRRLLGLAVRYESLGLESLKPLLRNLENIPNNSKIKAFWVRIFDSYADPSARLKSIMESLLKHYADSSVMKAIVYLLNKQSLVARWRIAEPLNKPGHPIGSQSTRFLSFFTYDYSKELHDIPITNNRMWKLLTQIVGQEPEYDKDEYTTEKLFQELFDLGIAPSQV